MSSHCEHLIPSKFWLPKPFCRILTSHHNRRCHRITQPTLSTNNRCRLCPNRNQAIERIMNMRAAFVSSRSRNCAVATVFVPELLVATGLALFVAAAVAFVVAAAAAVVDDDEADALDVAPGPVTGPPAMLIALVVPN
jgi:hypothetical protein